MHPTNTTECANAYEILLSILPTNKGLRVPNGYSVEHTWHDMTCTARRREQNGMECNRVEQSRTLGMSIRTTIQFVPNLKLLLVFVGRQRVSVCICFTMTHNFPIIFWYVYPDFSVSNLLVSHEIINFLVIFSSVSCLSSISFSSTAHQFLTSLFLMSVSFIHH